MSKNPHQALLPPCKCCTDLNEHIGHHVGWKTMYPYNIFFLLVVPPIGSNFVIFSVGFFLVFFSFGGKDVTILCMRSRAIMILCCSSTEHVTSASYQSSINRLHLAHTRSCIRHFRLGHTLHHALSIGTIANRCFFVLHCVCILCTVNILSVEHIYILNNW